MTIYPHSKFVLSDTGFKIRRNLIVFNILGVLILVGELTYPLEVKFLGISITLSQEKIYYGILAAIIVQATYFLGLVVNEFNRHWSDSEEVDKRELERRSLSSSVWNCPTRPLRQYLGKIGFFEVAYPLLFSITVMFLFLFRLF